MPPSGTAVIYVIYDLTSGAAASRGSDYGFRASERVSAAPSLRPGMICRDRGGRRSYDTNVIYANLVIYGEYQRLNRMTEPEDSSCMDESVRAQVGQTRSRVKSDRSFWGGAQERTD
jgi:hypothetical protein